MNEYVKDDGLEKLQLYGGVEKSNKCRLCKDEQINFVVYMCILCKDKFKFCCSCCDVQNIKILSCNKCTDGRYSIYISKFYEENKFIFENNNAEIISRREIEPLKCDECENFYYDLIRHNVMLLWF